MTRKKGKYDVDRIPLRVDVSDNPEVKKYLRKCLKNYTEPKTDFLEPEAPGEGTITVIAERYEIGDIVSDDDRLYFNNIDNVQKCYLKIEEAEDNPDSFECTVILVVKIMITDADIRRARRNKYLITYGAIFLIGLMGIVVLIRGQVFDGIVCLLMLPVIFYLGIIRTRGKDKKFLPEDKRKQK